MKIKISLNLLLCLFLLNCSTDDTNSEPKENIFEGDIILKSQSDVDQLRDNKYTKITGDLRIETALSTTDIFNLSVFDNLTEVGGDFVLENNSGVTSLNDFSKIELIGGSLKLDNNGIRDLDGLINLKSIGFSLIIRRNALGSINGLENLQEIGGDFIVIQSQIDNLQAFNQVTSTLSGFIWLEMKNLENLIGLPKIGINTKSIIISQTKIQGLQSFSNLQNINGILEIINNDNLESLDGFQNINSIKGELSIRGNDALKNLDQINNLSNLYGELDIFGNINLENINGLSKITSINGNPDITDGNFLGNIKIEFNDKLKDLNGLENITSLSNRVTIKNNPTLTDFCALDGLINNGQKALSISANAYNPSLQDFLDGNCKL